LLQPKTITNPMDKKDQQKEQKPTVPQNKQSKPSKQQRELEAFKRRYFDYYDDVKISVREDW